MLRTWAPWAGARLFAEGFLYLTWPMWRAARRDHAARCRSAHGCSTRCCTASPAVEHEEVDEQAIEEEIRTIVGEGHREGLLEDEAREMIEGVIDLGDAYVSQIMTPRTDMHMIHVEAPWDEMLAEVIESGHTRIPVFDKTRDDIVGILYSKDLLPETRHGRPQLAHAAARARAQAAVRARDQGGRRPAARCSSSFARTSPWCSTSTAASRAW